MNIMSCSAGCKFFVILILLVPVCQDTYTKSSFECSNNTWFYIKINFTQLSVKASNLQVNMMPKLLQMPQAVT